jgi:predicted flavoprotein YhiN
MDDHSTAGDSTKSVPIIPKRLWSALVTYSEIPLTTTWGDASKTMIRSLASNLTAFPLRVTSKGIFKDEFVTAGGVQLNEVQMSNMQSKVNPGLFMCGEVLDVDGVTGGFNFMSCWSTGFVAGEGAAKFCYDEQEH